MVLFGQLSVPPAEFARLLERIADPWWRAARLPRVARCNVDQLEPVRGSAAAPTTNDVLVNRLCCYGTTVKVVSFVCV